MATKLFVGNLPFSATNADLESLFGQVGAVASVNIIMDKFTGRSRGFGFVEMNSNQEAQTAIERFNGHELQGRALTVNEAKPQESRGGGGGRSFGGGGGGGGRGGFSRGGGGGGGSGSGGGGRERRW
jgi:RNA recognition motif-containing protein